MDNPSKTLVTPVYSRRDNVARTVLARVPANDIGQEKIDCTLKVNVKSAYFKEQLLSSGMHRPYLEINGSVEEVFLEDGKVFPCGTTTMSMNTPQDVRVLYVISTNELHGLVNKGFYYNDFEVPPNLIDNIIEIPSDITYTCVYDSPLGIVEINHPFEIQTSTRENHYDGLFDTCAVSKQRYAEEEQDYKFSLDKFSKETEPYATIIKDYLVDDVPTRTPELLDREIQSDDEANAVKRFVKVLEQEEEERVESRKAIAKNEPKRRRTVAEIRAESERRKQEQQAEEKATQDIYAQLMGTSKKESATDSNVTGDKIKYDDFKDAMALIQARMKTEDSDGSNEKKSEKDAKDSREKARLVDRALDNQALNAGITDTAGFGADVTGNEAKMSKEEKAKMQFKKSSEAARVVDRALDNQALNAGITDIAGQGASSDKKSDASKKGMVGAMLSLLGEKKAESEKTDDSPNYL